MVIGEVQEGSFGCAVVMTVLDPFPPIILHNLIVVGLAIGASRIIRNRHLAVAVAFLCGLAASLLWRHIGFEFEAGWRDLLYEPVFEGKLWRYLDKEGVIGFVLNWILPITLCYLTLWVLSKPKPDGVRKSLKCLGAAVGILSCAYLLSSVFCTTRSPSGRIVRARLCFENLRIALQAYHQDVGYYPPGDAGNDEGSY